MNDAIQRLNNNNLSNRHKPLKRIDRINGFCSSRCAEERSAGSTRIASNMTAKARITMMTIFIMLSSYHIFHDFMLSSNDRAASGVY
ncbi:MAG: hypothetical protein CBC12_02870 [Candidatus Puniceispirillum sp. TMED52]|nr:hypothetical protein [SAR116 cluster bacterium]OUU53199.1 MAG: hypothetical protein CBC12_02870 [Candidatus Puniceispirillum sp. TMED52]HCP17686.1 hypothetical protein [Alphaproteobacteria bacterium]|tara:strand:- start:1330 stop:1590 length:261 start_codon:yes stop_codon:yes gene_type:complete